MNPTPVDRSFPPACSSAWSTCGKLLLIASLLVAPAPGAPIEQLMHAGNVPGLAYAIVRRGKVETVQSIGVRNARTGVPVDSETVFIAASLGKPVFAYAVLQLVDQGKLNLDEPLSKYLPNYVPGDAAAETITARHVLSHTTGFPNWRNDEFPMRTYFTPGSRFSYSGEGLVYLQRVLEKVTGESFDTIMQRLVFDPLDMRRSAYTWQGRFENNYADPHDSYGRPSPHPKRTFAKSASTFQTTAVDYAKFLVAVFDGKGLKPATHEEWFRPQVEVKHRRPQALGSNVPVVNTQVAWGLGWALEPDHQLFFHWGNNFGIRAYVVGSRAERSAMVVFTNGAMGLAMMPELIRNVFAGDRPSLKWLEYEPLDSPRRRLIKSLQSESTGPGAHARLPAVWDQIKGDELPFDDQQDISSDLLDLDLVADALWIRQRTANAFPGSAAAQADLGHIFLIQKDYPRALAIYRKALANAPQNKRLQSIVELLAEKTYPVPQSTGNVSLHLKGFPTARRVTVAGEFNGMSRYTLPLQRVADGWSISFNVAPGSYSYTFSIDGTVMPDPTNPKHVRDEDPDTASLLIVGQPSVAADGSALSASDEAAIKQAGADYIEGWYAGDAVRMERALHPELAKRIVRRNEGTGNLDQMSALTLVQRTKTGIGKKDSPKRADILVLSHYEGAASVRIDATGWVDFLHLGKFGQEWKIVNVLWERRPAKS